MSRPRVPFEQRFFSRIVKHEDTGCWEWTGARYGTNHAYGSITYNGRKMGAHMASYKYHYGEYDPDLEVMHKCDNPICVNPEHLELGTHYQNMHDMLDRGRGNKAHGEHHHNHKFTADQVREIRRLAAEGMSNREIAKLYGVSGTGINYVVNRRRWAHIE